MGIKNAQAITELQRPINIEKTFISLVQKLKWKQTIMYIFPLLRFKKLKTNQE